MESLNQKINCRKFATLQELKDKFGTVNPNESGDSCSGCPNMMFLSGLMTCKYLHRLIGKGRMV